LNLLILYATLTITLSFLCSVLEAVLLSVNSTFLKIKISEGKKYAENLQRMKNNIDEPLIIILTLNTIAHTVGAILVGVQAKEVYSSFNNISFILHQPQLSENIGACARAIKNFNFKKLVIVRPKPIFPNDKILATSVGAKDLIINTKVHETLESAVKKVDYVIATSARFRNKNIKHINLEGLKKIDFNKKIAFLFGSEASGLSNNEISYANYTMQIPTNPDFKSLNLSHSVIIIAQTVASIISLKGSKYSKSNKVSLASKKEVQAMTNLCINKLEEKNFFKPLEKKPIMLENLRSIFSKMELSEKETRILSSVFASLSKKG